MKDQYGFGTSWNSGDELREKLAPFHPGPFLSQGEIRGHNTNFSDGQSAAFAISVLVISLPAEQQYAHAHLFLP